MFVVLYYQYCSDIFYIGQVNDNGIPHGKGMMSIGTNMFYKGDFNNNLFHGNGILECRNDIRYIGEFNDNYPHGIGKYIEKKHIFEGEFNKGFPHGKIVETIPKLGIRECEFINGHANGIGITKYNNGIIHKGFIKNNMYNGFGIMYNSDETVLYVGEWKNSKRHGKGISYQNGIKYDGEWIDDMPSGRGALTNNNGVTFHGVFQNGNIIECYYSNNNSTIDDEKDMDISG